MPHRVESLQMPPTHRRDYDYTYDHACRRPTPPPIATLSHSPSLSVSSLDRSSPAPRRSSTDPHAAYSDPYYSQHDHVARQPRPTYTHDPVRDSGRSSYAYRPATEHRYSTDSSHPYHLSSAYTTTSPALSHTSPARETGSLSYPLPGQSHYSIGYTDDAATKLSDRVRRRCFNCCTTDTSTWRRSNLSPGKVLCNKCGLFERTHGRSRPDQFPHRRGPLATSMARPRTPPPPQPPASSSSSSSSSHAHSSQLLPPISTHMTPLAPYHYGHPSIAPLTSIPDARRPQHAHQLPEIQSWIDAPPPVGSAARMSSSSTSTSSSNSSAQDHRGQSALVPLRQRSPPPPRSMQHPHHVDMRSSSVHEAVA
ncbi:hypothetical protein F5I97DRAFT_1136553 [Phlebopus sp. FC_14]|nr:hypothetical protein F5I97DRAFT_1136553 [Phlebopus sp. FC_14]